jgi:hypothetical protein
MNKWPRLVAWVAGSLLLLLGALQGYTRFPSAAAAPAAAVPADTRHLIVVIHGSGGRSDPTVLALHQRLLELTAGVAGVSVLRYVWSPESDNRLRAGAHGERMGMLLGQQLAAVPTLESLHLVGHSAGSYLLDPLCEAFKAARAARSARVVTTFLDPITTRGLLEPGWGRAHFGRCGDYADAYINTDDPVPGTNAPLEQAWNVDVTAAGVARDPARNGHRWPVRYYTEKLRAGQLLACRDTQARRPRSRSIQRKAPPRDASRSSTSCSAGPAP